MQRTREGKCGERSRPEANHEGRCSPPWLLFRSIRGLLEELHTGVHFLQQSDIHFR